jgi:homoserine O-acetyltransferase
LAAGHPGLDAAMKPLRAKMLIVALSSDWLFPPEQSAELSNALLRGGKEVSYCTLHASHGHDAFLVDINHLTEVVRAFLPWVSPSGNAAATDPEAGNGRQRGMGLSDVVSEAAAGRAARRLMEMIAPGCRVLDLGCGSGALLAMLHEKRATSGIGVDIDINHVIDVIDRGYDILQGDIDEGLASVPDGSYDYAVLNETLQVVRRPQLVLREMLRVAREGIVTFPNFAKWQFRAQLGLGGRMPKGKVLPFEWYNTPNIHLFTLYDFFDLCDKEGIRILDTACLAESRIGSLLVRMRLCNIGADTVIARITKEDPARPRGNGRRGKRAPCS